MSPCALGAAVKTGWCVLVAVSGDRTDPEVVLRQRVELCPEALPAFAYHVAAELPLEKAKPMVEEVHTAAGAAAATGLRATVAELASNDRTVAALAVSAGTDDFTDDLAWIVKSHMRLHTAEGELYREALVDAADALAVPVVRFPKGEAVAELARELGRDPAALNGSIAGWRKALGPPWAKEHKEAAAAAWLALLRS